MQNTDFSCLKRIAKLKKDLAEKAEKVAEAALKGTLNVTIFTSRMEYH